MRHSWETPPAIPDVVVEHELGRGASSVVYRALRRGTPCAVKIATDPRAARWFRREAAALGRISEPGLPAVLDVGEAGGVPYLVMELAAGETLDERLRRGLLDVAGTLALGRGLAHVLDAVHRRGLVHRDIKPVNIVIAPDDTVRLVDFGFATFSHAPRDAAGTRRYAAPEQLRVPVLVDGRTDLYALGCVLWECLTGAPPAGAPLLEANDSFGPLAAVVQGLVQAQPSQRYGTARALLEDLERIARDEPPHGPGLSKRLDSEAFSFVGREAELLRFNLAWGDADSGWGTAHVLRGSRGAGKSRLLRELGRDITRRAGEGHVVMVRCEESDLQPPAALRQLLDGLVRAASSRNDPRTADEIARAVGHDLLPYAAKLSPALREWWPGVRLPADQVGADAFSELIVEVLTRLVRCLAPILLVIDDAQWMDAMSVEAMSRLVQRTRSLPLLLVIATRDGASSSWIRLEGSLGESLHGVQLGGFSDVAASALVTSFLGRPPPEALVDWVVAVADGTPLGLLEVLDAMLESGALAPYEGGWRFEREPANRMHLPHGALRLLERRLGELALATRRVLEAAAVLGSAFGESVVAEMVGIEPRDIGFALAEAQRAGLIEWDGTSHHFVHDSVREVLLGALDLELKRTLHQQAADILEGLGVDPYVIANHLLAADPARSPARLLRITREAMERALDQFDNDAALQVFERTRAAIGSSDPAFDESLFRSAGEAALRLGAYSECVGFFELALRAAARSMDRAAILGRIAWAHQMRANADASWQILSRAFLELGVTMPTESASAALQLIVDMGRAKLGGGSSPDDRATLELLCNLHYQNARLGLEYGRPARLLQSTLQAHQLASRLGPGPTLAKTEALYGAVLTILGRRGAGTEHIDRGRNIAAQVGSPTIEAYCAQLSVVAAQFAGKFDLALELMRELLDNKGHWLEAHEFYANVYAVELIESVRGRQREAWAWLERAHTRAARGGRASIGYARVAFSTRAAWAAAHLEMDDHALAKVLRVPFDFTERCDGFVKTCTWGARARYWVERGEIGEELEHLIEEFRAENPSPRKVHPVLVEYYVAVAQARVQQAIRSSAKERRERRLNLESAIDDLRAVARFPLIEAHLRAAEGVQAWLGGSVRKAQRKLAQAEQLADKETCPRVLYDVARARAHMLRAAGKHDAARERARLAAEIARHQGAVHWERWIREEFALPVARPASTSYLMPLSGRSRSTTSSRRQLQALLRVLQVSSAAIDAERLAHVLVDELLVSMDADRGVLWFEADGRGAPGQVAGRTRSGEGWADVPASTRALMDRARSSGMLQQGEEERSGPRRLAVPLWLREKVIGVSYLERDAGRPPYGDEDMETLVALSYQVPIALELARALKERDRIEENLRHAQKMEAIGRFAGGIAHDFNNMLTVMTASLESMRDRSMSDELDEDVELMHAAVTRATALTKQLLTFSRRHAREVAVHDLVEVIVELGPLIQRLIGDHIQVKLSRCDGATRISVDRDMLEQAVVNLASNARDAMPRGGQLVLDIARVEIDQALSDALVGLQPGPCICLSVRDTGVGMPREIRDNVFDPFFTTKEHGRGTGLGLSMVYGFVRQSGGVIVLESELGRGTEFRLFFPEAVEERAAPPRPLVEVGNGGHVRAAASGKPATILIVDDERQVRNVLQRVLVRDGYRVVASDHPREALELAGELGSELDLLITDVLMPEMNGPELAEAVLEVAPRAKLLFISGYTDGDLQDVLARRDAPFLQKPFLPDTMRGVVERLLHGDTVPGP